MAEYIDREQVCENCNNKNYCEKEKCPVYKVSTADVVPKSEVEMLQGALKAEERHNELTMEMAQKAIANAKAEVAREIFEEIEEVFRQHTEGGYYLNGAWFPERLDLYTGDAIAELKKKYTERDT